MLLVHQPYPVRRPSFLGASQSGRSASAGAYSIARLLKTKPAVCIARGACSMCAPTQSMGARNTDITRWIPYKRRPCRCGRPKHCSVRLLSPFSRITRWYGASLSRGRREVVHPPIRIPQKWTEDRPAVALTQGIGARKHHVSTPLKRRPGMAPHIAEKSFYNHMIDTLHIKALFGNPATLPSHRFNQ